MSETETPTRETCAYCRFLTGEESDPRTCVLNCPCCRNGHGWIHEQTAKPNRSYWTSPNTWRDPDCIECGGDGAPCCEPPNDPYATTDHPEAVRALRDIRSELERDEIRANLREYVSRYHLLAFEHDELERRYALLSQQVRDFMERCPSGQAEAWRSGFASLLREFDSIDRAED